MHQFSIWFKAVGSRLVHFAMQAVGVVPDLFNRPYVA